MNLPTAILIPFPPDQEKIAEEFYGKKLGLKIYEEDFLLPNSNQTVLRLRKCEEILLINTQFKTPSLFSTSIENNMLSKCQEWISCGVEINYLRSDPGGYAAIIIDPFGNKMEFTCDNWDEDNKNINPFEWDFYKRY